MAKLPNVSFERGLMLLQSQVRFGDLRQTEAYLIIGRLESGVPFLLNYSGLGVTNWWCVDKLGDSLRRKILELLRTEVRYATPPAYLTIHDLRDLDQQDPTAGLKQAETLWFGFFNEEWRAQTLGERDEDWIDLVVPFAERQAANDAGAKWDGSRKRWRVKLQPDMSAFAKWLPEAAV